MTTASTRILPLHLLLQPMHWKPQEADLPSESAAKAGVELSELWGQHACCRWVSCSVPALGLSCSQLCGFPLGHDPDLFASDSLPLAWHVTPGGYPLHILPCELLNSPKSCRWVTVGAAFPRLSQNFQIGGEAGGERTFSPQESSRPSPQCIPECLAVPLPLVLFYFPSSAPERLLPTPIRPPV